MAASADGPQLGVRDAGDHVGDAVLKERPRARREKSSNSMRHNLLAGVRVVGECGLRAAAEHLRLAVGPVIDDRRAVGLAMIAVADALGRCGLCR